MFTSNHKGKLPGARVVGGKGFGLMCMSQRKKCPVPPFAILPTTLCQDYRANPTGAMEHVASKLPEIKQFFEAEFGYMPLVSVRSSGPVSMPGMMDTILNVGLVPHEGGNFAEWEKRLGYQCAKDCVKAQADGFYKAMGQGMLSVEFNTVDNQLLAAVEAVFRSSNSERAIEYRKLNGIEDLGTAVVVQAMVFGNHNSKSCTGVVFSANPDTGVDVLTGEFLPGAQGEALVGGVSQGHPIAMMSTWNSNAAGALQKFASQLAHFKRYPQEIEFTVDDGVLWLLQMRDVKPSPQAALRIALRMAMVYPPKEALSHVTRRQYALAVVPRIDPSFEDKPLFMGLGACPGLATGEVVHTAGGALDCSEPSILVRQQTSVYDLSGIVAARGLLTTQGGITSHAAVVARGMNKPCVVGIGDEALNSLEENTLITIDGSTGAVYLGKVPVIEGDLELRRDFDRLMFDTLAATPINEVISGGTVAVDVSEELYFGVEPAVAKVAQALKQAERVLVLCRPVEVHEADRYFYHDMLGFEDPDRQPFLKALGELPEKQRITLIAEQSQGLDSLSYIASLDQLVLAQQPGILTVPVDAAMARVIGWKKAEGIECFYVFGVSGNGKSILSREQAVANLLG